MTVKLEVFYCEGDGAVAQVAQRDCGVFILGDIRNPSGCGPGKLAAGGPAYYTGQWTR